MADHPHLHRFNQMLQAIQTEHDFWRLYREITPTNCRFYNKSSGKRVIIFRTRANDRVGYTYNGVPASKGETSWKNLKNIFIIKAK